VKKFPCLLALFLALFAFASAAEPSRGDKMLAQYFADETARLERTAPPAPASAADWAERVTQDRTQLQEMLGLLPWPERTDLKATVTGREETADIVVEKLHFQSLPGLYVTANLYRPRQVTGKLPAVLYVCGHAVVRERGVSLGNKTGYQHHGAWFARHGYVCLTIDTIQLGELEGIHHGTHRLGLYGWNSRGYTPAGVEAWNGIRAIDYLLSRPEVDGTRVGITGRSGGGAYSWYTAALDERIKVVVPVAGITDLHNHVVDGTVKGHCDCMFMVNTYRWDYARLAALIAPRPLLFANSDKDPIFPLDGVLRVHREVAAVYRALGASSKLGLLITEGPHQDTQDLQVPAFRWFNRFLKNEDPLIRVAAEKLFPPAQLRVFTPGQEPADQRTTRIHESFVPTAHAALPTDAAAWTRQRDAWLTSLRTKSFAGWPTSTDALDLRAGSDRATEKLRVTDYEFTSQGAIRLPLRLHRALTGKAPARVVLRVLDDASWTDAPLPLELAAAVERGEVAVFDFAPRGLGPTASTASAADQNQLRRRYLLLGQTVDGMRVWDIQRAVAAVRSSSVLGRTPITLQANGDQAVNALYASLFIDGLAQLELTRLPASHATGPDYLNVLRILDVPQAATMAAERQPVKLLGANPDDWSWTTRANRQLGWSPDRFGW
jgi:dienelactone hydrolase